MYSFWFLLCALLLLQTAHGQLASESEELEIEGRTNFDDYLREVMEFLRLQMPCGYAPAGIPPLVPLYAPYREVEWITSKSEIRGNVTELTVTGLDEFDIRELHYNNLLRRVRYDLNFPEILFTGDYKTDIITKLFGPKVHVYGDGELHLTLKNLRIYGSFIVRPKASGTMKLTKFKATTELGGVESELTGIMNSPTMTKFFNGWIEEFINQTFNDSEEEVDAALQRWFVPLATKALDEVSVIGLVALMLGVIEGTLPQETLC